MLCRILIRWPQDGQCEGGRDNDSPRGTRQMTTFRKEPIAKPRTAITAISGAIALPFLMR